MRVCVFENQVVLAQNFCEELKRLVKNSDENFSIALSGGSTPEIIYKELGKNYSDKIDWTKIKFFWGDERCVPPEDAESNYRMVKKNLFDKIEISNENIFRIKGEENPEEESKRYDEILQNNVEIVDGCPRFNLLMLGLGEDGHTASIFPDQINLMNSKQLAAVALHPETGQKRITLTGRVLNNSKRVYFFVTGEKKSGIVSEVISQSNDKYPAAKINPVGKLLWYLDEAAASKLEKKI